MDDVCNHGYFTCCTIYSQLYGRLCLIGIDKRENDFIDNLIQYTCNTQYQNGKGITEHPLH